MNKDKRILELEELLAEAKQNLIENNTYIHETNSLHCSDGEMYFSYGDIDNEKVLVYNIESLYKDLPFIIDQVCKEQKKQQKNTLENIKETIKEL